MTHEERKVLIDKLADRITDDCPIEALMQHFYNDQYEYFTEMSDEELLEAKVDLLGD